MLYNKIRNELNKFYFEDLPGKVERIRADVYGKMDNYAQNNPHQNSYLLKSQLYRTIAETIEPVLFEDIPFFYETSSLVAFSDGRSCRGAEHANGWLYNRNKHLFADADPEAYELYRYNGGLYSQAGIYVDMMHNAIPLRKVFSIGLGGVYAELEKALEENLSEEETSFLRCAMTGIEALHSMQLKFADAAFEKGMEDLYQIAARIPWEPPKTMHDGLCAMAFMRKVFGAMEGVGFSSFGRVDVLLASLYEKDIKSGVAQEQLLDLVCRFLLIWDCTLDRRKKMEGRYEYELENSLTLGGMDEDGNPVFNGVTRLFLEAREKLNILYPKMMLRYSASSPTQYLQLITNPLMKSKGFSLFENDDAVIPALIEYGMDPADAANYAVGGCWDILTPDCSTNDCGEYINILKPLEWSIHRKTKEMEETKIYFQPLDELESFEAVYEVYLDFIRRVLMRKAALQAKGSKTWVKVDPICIFSSLLETCIPQRRDITAGGGKYNRECVYFVGFAEVVDSLLVIKKLCFEEGLCTLPELMEACRQNWPDESLRRRAIDICSFGDGSEESTAFAGRLFDDLYRISRDLPTAYGGQFRVGYNLYTEVIWVGKQIATTPNGRRNGDYISQGISPSRLQKTPSLSDVLYSFHGMDMKKCCGNSSVSMNLPAGEIDQEQLISFLRATAKSGIQGLQPNCVSKEDLLAAQKNPEEYGHIIVRVCGFSAPFVSLSPVYQQEFLSRNFHSL